MKLTALAVVILALGIVVGFALAGGSSGGPASAVPQCPGPSSQCPTPTPAPPTPTPAPPQQREDQVTIYSRGDAAGANTGSAEFERISPNEIALDSAEYPSPSTFSLEVVVDSGVESTNCIRLYDLTLNEPVSGSDLCATRGLVPAGVSARLRSDPFSLQAGDHAYTLQGMKLAGGSPLVVFAARIIVEWTE